MSSDSETYLIFVVIKVCDVSLQKPNLILDTDKSVTQFSRKEDTNKLLYPVVYDYFVKRSQKVEPNCDRFFFFYSFEKQ